MPQITLTRHDLYVRVWTTPIHTLARELGLSGRGLGKVCTRHDIPVPPRGYWAKKASGKRVKQPALPSPETFGQKIRFARSAVSVRAGGLSANADTEIHPLILFERDPVQAIRVPDDLTLTDPLVLKTQRRLTRGKREPTGLIAAPADALYVHTSRAQHERALRIIQALFGAFHQRGIPVAATDQGVDVRILDESIGIGIEEQLKKVEHRTTFTEQKLIERGYGWQVPKADHVPSGVLTLVIRNVSGVRQRWSEGRQPLEKMLNTFLIGLVRAAFGLKRQRAVADERERQQQEEERQRQEEARRQAEIEQRWREEETKVACFERLERVWRRNQGLRSLLENIRSAMGEMAPSSDLGQWVDWATRHVEGSDPLRHVRKREERTLTLYYHGYDHASVPEQGFKEPGQLLYGQEKPKPGVELTCSPPRITAYKSALKVEVSEDVVLPFEWAQESDWYWRVFRVPAAVLNRTLSYGTSELEIGADTHDVEGDTGE